MSYIARGARGGPYVYSDDLAMRFYNLPGGMDTAIPLNRKGITGNTHLWGELEATRHVLPVPMLPPMRTDRSSGSLKS